MIFVLKVIIAERFFWVARGSWKQQAWFDKIKIMTAFDDHRKKNNKGDYLQGKFLVSFILQFFLQKSIPTWEVMFSRNVNNVRAAS